MIILTKEGGSIELQSQMEGMRDALYLRDRALTLLRSADTLPMRVSGTKCGGRTEHDTRGAKGVGDDGHGCAGDSVGVAGGGSTSLSVDNVGSYRGSDADGVGCGSDRTAETDRRWGGGRSGRIAAKASSVVRDNDRNSSDGSSVSNPRHESAGDQAIFRSHENLCTGVSTVPHDAEGRGGAGKGARSDADASSTSHPDRGRNAMPVSVTAGAVSQGVDPHACASRSWAVPLTATACTKSAATENGRGIASTMARVKDHDGSLRPRCPPPLRQESDQQHMPGQMEVDNEATGSGVTVESVVWAGGQAERVEGDGRPPPSVAEGHGKASTKVADRSQSPRRFSAKAVSARDEGSCTESTTREKDSHAVADHVLEAARSAHSMLLSFGDREHPREGGDAQACACESLSSPGAEGRPGITRRIGTIPPQHSETPHNLSGARR